METANNNPVSETVGIINVYLTPLAVILVSIAIVVSKPSGAALYISIALLCTAVLNNILTSILPRKNNAVIRFRMIFNVLVNIVLVYVLIGYWGPIWYLLLMTPVAAAVYSDRKQVILVSLGMSSVLVIIYLLRGVTGLQSWGQAASRILLMVILSLFINALVTRCYGRK